MIGLTYTHTNYTENNKLLPNYYYFLSKIYPETKNAYDDIAHFVYNGSLLSELSDLRHTRFFDSPVTQQILANAYENEIIYKFLWVTSHKENNHNDQKLIELFNTYFEIDYEELLEKYCSQCNRWELLSRHNNVRKQEYTDRKEVIELYLSFIEHICTIADQPHYGEAHRTFAAKHLIVEDKPWTTWEASRRWENVLITLGNNSYETLIHELVHFTHNFFEDIYEETSFDQLVTDSIEHEWLANFIAFHFMEYIIHDQKDITTISTDHSFFSYYIDIYATLRKDWWDTKEHNYTIVRNELISFEWEDITDAKVDFFFERFYKYFRYDQHKYFYPKELIYYVWYNKMLEWFTNAWDKHAWLFSMLTGDFDQSKQA